MANQPTLDLLMLGNATAPELIRQAQLAEAHGYHGAWVADERFYREVYSLLAVIARETKRINLGPCVTDPFARHPALTAMAIATLDEISGGRAILGLGAGISGFEEMKTPRPKPPKAMRETIALFRQLMTGEQVDFQGEVIQFSNGSLNFRPIRADVPVWVASNGPLGIQMAGAVADGLINEGAGTVEEIRALRELIAAGAAKAGRDPASVRLIARLNACIADDGKAARDVLRPSVARALGAGRTKRLTAEANGLVLPDEIVAPYADVPYHAGAAPVAPLLPLVTDRHVDAFALGGTVAEVAEHVRALLDAGADGVMIRPFAPPGGTMDVTVERLGREVWPLVLGQR